MTNKKLEKLIIAGETAREKNQNAKALKLLDSAITEAIKQQDYNALLKALGHKLLVWKHEFHRTNDSAFLELMVADAHAGYQIGIIKKVSKDNLAAMLLRIGHYHLFRHEYEAAEMFNKKSLSLISPKNPGKYAEYLGHYGLAAALANQKDWQKNFDRAFKLLNRRTALRPFHKLVIESGLYLRLAAIAAHKNDQPSLKKYLAYANKPALELKKKYKLGIRFEQVKKLTKNPKWMF